VYELFPKLLGQVFRKEASLAVALIDMDNLKIINDQEGHKEGDMAIVALSQLLQKHVRDSDIVSRWGGDEFVVIAPFTDSDQMERLMQRIIVQPNSKGVKFSYGIASYPEDGR